ncbi:hypothetical protein J5N97_004427 [Dioscorea zingiberensis]|uniref:RING-type E3 ubiquitin transferase n=1 Tax=Dioscorea zingiberensis TaxID=325984 RepID=A0A9D5HRR4_9LILI|nr:hypothetical protein J5N97_004427 [Dioscorea zingiberensis]
MWNTSILSLLLLLLLLLSGAGAQPAPPEKAPSPSLMKYTASFRPSVAIVIGIFAIMFSLTFLLLMYAKFCHVAATGLFLRDVDAGLDRLLLQPSQPRFSGVDKSVIESLPVFRFSSLRGSRDGLECSVCLSKFDDAEILRLLPKCKHAFHVDCVDRWLDSHSSCPLCRHRVDAADAEIFNHSSSSRFSLLNASSSRREDTTVTITTTDHNADDDVIELFIEREQENKPHFYHKFKHRIIVSDVMLKSRWSDVNSSDLMSLNSEMLSMMSGKRFDGIKEELEKKRLLENKMNQLNRSSDYAPTTTTKSSVDVGCSKSSLIPPGSRSMSEITNLARFDRDHHQSAGVEDEKTRRVWLPIARRTVQWFAGSDERTQLQNKTNDMEV